ncbi:hypothetical protein [Isoptericola croceus]|uniref:hypothetical protein n=1 Tax=Isoptericola croceus TaxID=3031406 RepID=UPI0023F7BB46|nr:hypothetical protein [Isoptericola croceus]
MNTTPLRDAEVADLDEVVDELIAYDAAALRRATTATQAVPVVTVRPPGTWSYGRVPDEFID